LTHTIHGHAYRDNCDQTDLVFTVTSLD
jgi:hypothetical protein